MLLVKPAAMLRVHLRWVAAVLSMTCNFVRDGFTAASPLVEILYELPSKGSRVGSNITRNREAIMAKTENIVFINATLLDGTADMEPQTGRAVVVENGRIAAIVPTEQAPAGPGYRVVDLAGAYLMPGLINMHVHFCGSGKPTSAGDAGALMKKLDNPFGRAIVRKLLRKSAQQQLASGVTTVRGAGDPLFADIAVRDGFNSGKYVGPRLIAPGTGVTVPNGHGAGLFAKIAETPEQAASLVREIAAHGADVIKLFVTGGVFDATKVGEPGVLRMSPEIASAACAAAHKLGLPVMAHVESTEGVQVALAAGVDTIEHGAPMTDEILALYRGGAGTQLPGRKPSVTCTISPALPFVKLSPEQTHSTEIQKANGDIVCAGIIQSAREALDAGIDVGLGTDSSCPYVTQYDMWREVAYFAKYVGVSNAFALHTATAVNARLLGLGDETGTIEVGKSADMIVLEKNPLDDLSVLSDVKHVMCRGTYLEHPKVKHLAELDHDLDWIMEQPVD